MYLLRRKKERKKRKKLSPSKPNSKTKLIYSNHFLLQFPSKCPKPKGREEAPAMIFLWQPSPLLPRRTIITSTSTSLPSLQALVPTPLGPVPPLGRPLEAQDLSHLLAQLHRSCSSSNCNCSRYNCSRCSNVVAPQCRHHLHHLDTRRRDISCGTQRMMTQTR